MARIGMRMMLGGLALALIGTATAKETVVVPNKWLIELADPPALAFEGGPVPSLADTGPASSTRSLEATAPHASGRAKYDPDAPEVQAYLAHLGQERGQVLQLAGAELGRTIEPLSTYHHVLNGFVANVSKAEAKRLAALPGVKAVRPILAHKLEMDAGPEVIGARAVHAGVGSLPASGGEGTVIGIIDSGINWDHSYFSDEGLASGHEFENPYESQLGLCNQSAVNCNDKLVGVYDFTIEGTNGKDPDGHGTHVASTAAGVPLSYNLPNSGPYQYDTTGVAPHANIISYKVCYKEHPSDEELDDSCEGSAIMDAWEQAITDGVDVVNYSIGADPADPWTTSGWLLNMWTAGISFVTSAGNSGPSPGTVGSPANAPWVFAVGSTSHGRVSGDRVTVADSKNRLVLYGDGPSLTSTITAPVVPVDTVSADLRACSPFSTDALDGAIAFIERGDCTFETKVSHAEQAGALGVLVFNSEPGLPIVMGGLQGTSIPAAMMGRGDGLEALAAIQSASEPTASMFTGGFADRRSEWQDAMSDFSSRGPVDYPGVMKPNVVAPGSNIAAGWYDGPNSIAFISGTSMASPHVAGAVALLKSLHPEWSIDMLQSTLETTAESEPVTDAGDAASIFDRGAGRVRVDLAARAGLFLPVSRSEFQLANPSNGGDPATLNLAGLWNAECAGTCTFERTLEAIEGGSWSVSVEGDVPVSVSPNAFTLSAGQSQSLDIVATADGLAPGELGQARIVLTPADAQLATQKLTVGVQSAAIDLPTEIALDVEGNRGRSTVSVPAGVLPEAIFTSSELVRPTRESFELSQDTSPEAPYQGGLGRETFLVEVPDDSLMLMAEIVSSSANDLDLFVGRDDDGDGQAEESEERCRSTSPEELEACLIEAPQSGTWWIMVQNWEAAETLDEIELDWAVLAAGDDGSLVVSGPGTHASGTLDLELFWDQPRMARDERWVGAFGVLASPDDSEYVGVVPVFLTRTGALQTPTTPLFAGETTAVRVPGNGEHRRLYIDVPPSAESLSVELQGEAGLDVSIHRLDFDDLGAQEPDTPEAPVDGALASDSVSESGIELNLSGPLSAGRYFVVLDNTTSSEKQAEVTASYSETGGQPPRFSVWNPALRGTNQGIDWNAGGTGSAIWYTYDEDGVPTFYNAVGSIDSDRSTWTADLLRSTNIGVRNNIETVGRMNLTRVGPDDMMVSWRINGRHGSERMIPVIPPTCPEVGGQPASYTGSWSPSGSGVGGTTMMVTADTQAHIRYYFDHSGIGRWVITAGRGDGPLAEDLDLLEVRGFCPGCEETETSWETVGAYSRVFDDEDSATEIYEFQSLPPLNEEHSAEYNIMKLTSRLSCE